MSDVETQSPPVIEYARRDAAPRLLDRRAVLGAWLLPVCMHLLGWIFLFRPRGSDGVEIYVRNFVCAITGIPLFVATLMGMHTISLAGDFAFASVSWSVILILVTTSQGRALPWGAHLGLSFFWNLLGCFLYLVLRY
jgi:hypothetical protein